MGNGIIYATRRRLDFDASLLGLFLHTIANVSDTDTVIRYDFLPAPVRLRQGAECHFLGVADMASGHFVFDGEN